MKQRYKYFLGFDKLLKKNLVSRDAFSCKERMTTGYFRQSSFQKENLYFIGYQT
ncbi:hypothetical protein HMPREF6485_0758 [Segatella buccae ATCC 33574]|uniref:Uncharacterized protein n=1 Tax=Segatella buccae ATCC 33574 TaxID=873513 RepID=E6K586_9BACT|nr:hypothetical protein HMPREF6485_0758 [Segatella buccae ATCC 33574]